MLRPNETLERGDKDNQLYNLAVHASSGGPSLAIQAALVLSLASLRVRQDSRRKYMQSDCSDRQYIYRFVSL